MKIKTIKINGIRGFHYLDDSTNDPHIIKANGGNHLFIYGENGTGKSSFFDAMEWAICGEVTHEIKKRNADNSFIFNEFNRITDSPYVELTFDNLKKIVRKASKNKVNLIDDSHVLTPEMESLFIETNRIEKFVIDRKDNLWKNFSDLLGLEELLNFDKQLKNLVVRANKEYDEINRQCDLIGSEIKKLNDSINELIFKFKESLGDGWENQISKINVSEIKNYTTLELRKNNFLNNYEAQKAIENSIEEKKKELFEVSKTLLDIKIIPLINEANTYFQSNDELPKCPICDNEIVFREIKSKIKQSKESFKSYNDIKSSIDYLEKTKIQNLHNEFNSLKEIIIKLNLFEIKSDIEMDNFYKLLKEKESYLDEEIRKKTSSEFQNIKLYFDKRSEIEEKRSRIQKLERDLNIKLSVKKDITQVYNKYEVEYISKINSELNSISEDSVTKIYNQINQTENDNIDRIKIKADINNKTLEFIIKFEGSDSFINANKILSTGHLRCLGFALLLTRIIRKNPTLKTIFIDDPIYSIDHEHRYYLIKYLQSLGTNYQLVVLSSDRMFHEILTNTFSKDSYESYEICLTQMEGVCYKHSKIKATSNGFLSKAKEHLDQNDLRAASLYARLSFEKQLFDIAENVQINISFKRRNSISWADLIEADLKSAIVSKYPNTNESINNSEFNKVLEQRYFKSLIYAFPLNQEAHYPHPKRPFFTKDEINDVIKTIDEFNSYVKKVMNGVDMKV